MPSTKRTKGRLGQSMCICQSITIRTSNLRHVLITHVYEHRPKLGVAGSTTSEPPHSHRQLVALIVILRIGALGHTLFSLGSYAQCQGSVPLLVSASVRYHRVASFKKAEDSNSTRPTCRDIEIGSSSSPRGCMSVEKLFRGAWTQ